MTPKEKAFQLINRYLDINEEQEFNTPRYLTKEEAVEGALIAVDEIINSVVVTNLSVAENQFLFWEQVKTEINKL